LERKSSLEKNNQVTKALQLENNCLQHDNCAIKATAITADYSVKNNKYNLTLEQLQSDSGCIE